MTATSDKNKFNYKTNEVQSTRALREHLFKVLKDLFKQDYTNIETGLSTTFTDKDANKISHPTAIKKSRDNGFKKEEHFKVAENLVPLYENATLKETHPDYKGKPNIANVHRFHIDVNINDKEAEAKITVYEKIEGRNRIHTIELLKKLNPLPYSSRVQETEVAKSLNNGEVAHTTTPPIANSDSATIPNPTLKNTETQSKNAVKETLGNYGDIVKTLNRDTLNSDYTIPSNDDNGIKLKSLVDASEIQSSNKQSSSPKGADKPKIKTMFGKKNNGENND